VSAYTLVSRGNAALKRGSLYARIVFKASVVGHVWGTAAAGSGQRIKSLKHGQIISIVDDDASVRDSTRNLVRSLGHEAVTFDSAEAFLNSGHIDDTACLITDLQMPGMSGLQLQTQLIEQGHRLPIIVITAYPEPRARAQALAAGALGFLSKPFKDENLITCLDQALGVGGHS
jgi:FixJ family two-component response regulator